MQVACVIFAARPKMLGFFSRGWLTGAKHDLSRALWTQLSLNCRLRDKVIFNKGLFIAHTWKGKPFWLPCISDGFELDCKRPSSQVCWAHTRGKPTPLLLSCSFDNCTILPAPISQLCKDCREQSNLKKHLLKLFNVSGEPVWAVHYFIACPVAVPGGLCHGRRDRHYVALTVVLVSFKLFWESFFPADLTAVMVSAHICGKMSCWFICGSLTKGNLCLGFEEAGQPPGAFSCSQRNPRARDGDKGQILVSIHFFKTSPFSKNSFHSDRELWHHCEGPKSHSRVLARNWAVRPAPEQLAPAPAVFTAGLCFKHLPCPPATVLAACGLYPWALQLCLITGETSSSKNRNMLYLGLAVFKLSLL